MGFGESGFDVHPRLQDELKNNSHRKSYLQAKGLPELCERVAGYYSEKLGVNFLSGRAIIGLFSTPYREFQLQIRQKMTELFTDSGFDAAKDIEGIIANRWGHAYIVP